MQVGWPEDADSLTHRLRWKQRDSTRGRHTEHSHAKKIYVYPREYSEVVVRRCCYYTVFCTVSYMSYTYFTYGLYTEKQLFLKLKKTEQKRFNTSHIHVDTRIALQLYTVVKKIHHILGSAAQFQPKSRIFSGEKWKYMSNLLWKLSLKRRKKG